MLRDPASRSYSHYFHLVKSGRTTKNFEEELQFGENTIIQRSLYKAQIKRLLDNIPREQVKFILFEDFVSDIREVTKKVMRFIGADLSEIDPSKLNAHRNKASARKSLKLQLLRNKFTGPRVSYSYLPWMPRNENNTKGFLRRAIDKLHHIMNPVISDKPLMNKETRKFLDDYFN